MSYKYIYIFSLIFLEVACAMEPIKTRDENTVFYESIRKNDMVGIQHFYSAVKSNLSGDYEDPLIYSARVGAKASLNFILHNYYMDEYSIQFRNQAFLTSSFNGDIESMKALMLVGVDINYSADGIVNPIWASIEGGHSEAFKYLLSLGADYKFVNKKGENLLFPSVVLGDLEIIKILIDLGLNPKVDINNGEQARNLKDYASYRWKNNPEHLDEIIKLIGIH